MIDEIDLPTMFVRDPVTHKVIPEMVEGCEWAKDRTDTLLTIKLDGHLCKLVYDTTAGAKELWRKMGDVWFKCDREHPMDKYLWEAYDNRSKYYPLAAGFYVVFGPNINNNSMNTSEHSMLRIAPVDAVILTPWPQVDIKRGPAFTVQEFYDSVKKELEESTVQGFIFQWEKPQLQPYKFCQVTRKDMGFSWPIAVAPAIGADVITGERIIAVNSDIPFGVL